MNNNLLSSIGLGNIDMGIVLIVITVVIIVLLVLLINTRLKLSRLTEKYNFFMKGRAPQNLETEIMELFNDNSAMKQDIEKNKSDVRTLYRKAEGSYQKMGLVKYDAFDQMGGKLSFCLCLLDEDNSGFLMNSVHSTESSYCYIKRITAGSCKQDLTNEEQVALQRAIAGQEYETN